MDLSKAKPGELPPSVTKKILCGGKGDKTGPYPYNTKITFHYKAHVADNPEEVVEDTYKLNPNQPAHILMGRQFKMEIWELIFHTLHHNERAEFFVPKIVKIHTNYLQEFPLVAKTFRDTVKTLSNPVHARCCGAMTSLGYKDLDKLAQNPRDLVFTFQIVKIEYPGEYEEISWQLSPEEKLASVSKLKESGNEMFKNGEFKAARLKYFSAISRIEELLIREKPGSQEHEELQHMKVPLLLNYVLCLMKFEEFYEAIVHLNTVLDVDKENVKAYYRRGKCHTAVGNYDLALRDYQQTAKLDSTLTAEITKCINIMAKEKKCYEQKQSKTLKNIFT